MTDGPAIDPDSTDGMDPAARTCVTCLARTRRGEYSFSDDTLAALIAEDLRDHRYQRGGGGVEVDGGDRYRAGTLVHLVLSHSAEVERLLAVEADERQHCDEQSREIRDLSLKVRAQERELTRLRALTGQRPMMIGPADAGR